MLITPQNKDDLMDAQIRYWQVCDLLGIARTSIQVSEPPPINDFDNTRRLSWWTNTSSGVRLGGRIAYSMHVLRDPFLGEDVRREIPANIIRKTTLERLMLREHPGCYHWIHEAIDLHAAYPGVTSLEKAIQMRRRDWFWKPWRELFADIRRWPSRLRWWIVYRWNYMPAEEDNDEI